MENDRGRVPLDKGLPPGPGASRDQDREKEATYCVNLTGSLPGTTTRMVCSEQISEDLLNKCFWRELCLFLRIFIFNKKFTYFLCVLQF